MQDYYCLLTHGYKTEKCYTANEPFEKIESYLKSINLSYKQVFNKSDGKMQVIVYQYSMAGESGTSRHGNTHYYYKCGSAKRKQGCKKRAVKKEWIENLVIQYVMKIVLDDDLIEKIADNILELLSTESSKIPQLKARLKETNRGIDNLLNAIQQGIFTPSTKQRLEELEELKKDIETAIMCEKLQRPEITKPHIIYYIKNFRNMNLDDLASKKRLIDSFVNSIFLYDDKIVFSFNYNDSTRELRIKDMEEELGSNLKGNAPPKNTDGVLAACLNGKITKSRIGRENPTWTKRVIIEFFL